MFSDVTRGCTCADRLVCPCSARVPAVIGPKAPSGCAVGACFTYCACNACCCLRRLAVDATLPSELLRLRLQVCLLHVSHPALYAAQAFLVAFILFTGLDIVPLVFTAVHGWRGLVNAVSHSSEAYSAGVTPQYLHLLSGPAPYDTTGLLTGGLLSSLWLFGAEFYTVQLGAAAKSQRHVRAAAVFVAFLLVRAACCSLIWTVVCVLVFALFDMVTQFLVPFAWSISGVAARMLFASGLQCSGSAPCGNGVAALAFLCVCVLPAFM
jgi:hypothetical protein